MKEVFALAICLSAAIPASGVGTNARTFVSFSGLDTNPCSRTSPCRSFDAALAQTAAGGTIIALDSAGYGTVTISQSVSLVAPLGVYAGMTAPMSGNAVTLSGGSSFDVVYLRGLSIEGAGVGFAGIYLNAQPIAQLHVENCVINGFLNGIRFYPSIPNASLFIADTTLANNTGTGLDAESINASVAHVSADHCRFTGNNYGVFINESNAAISNSVISGNTQGLFVQWSDSAATVDNCQISKNTTGITAQNGALIYVSNSTIFDNGTGLAKTGVSLGVIWSRAGDTNYPVKTNTLINNSTNGSFTGTFLAQ